MTPQDTMRLALEALERIYIAPEHEEYIRVWWPACEQAIEALRSALAQQGEQQQPMAWYLPQGTDDSLFRDHRTVVACTGNKWEGWIPLYAGAAPAAQPCCKEKENLEKFLQELSKQSGWASTVIRKYLNEMSSKEK